MKNLENKISKKEQKKNMGGKDKEFLSFINKTRGKGVAT
jgi:hypothetical protein